MTISRSMATGSNSRWITFKVCLLICAVGLNLSCANPKLGKSVRWTDPDMKNIAKPDVAEEYAVWDFVDHSIFYPLGTLLNLEWTALRLGGRLAVR